LRETAVGRKRVLREDEVNRAAGTPSDGTHRALPIAENTRELHMDALSLLTEDHQKVKKLMAEIEKTTERGVKTREALFGKLLTELTIHEQIEEQIFYPEVKEKATTKQLEELVTESYEEHHFVDTVKAEIQDTPFEADEWAAKFKVMKENVEHHAFEEEEGKMFPKVRKAFSKAELEDMGTRMAELKQQLMENAPEEAKR
jgi:hemerythrin superfamily protein